MKQISTSVPDDIFEEVYNLAKKETRSVSAMSSVLIQQAVKERNRKKKRATEKDHS